MSGSHAPPFSSSTPRRALHPYDRLVPHRRCPHQSNRLPRADAQHAMGSSVPLRVSKHKKGGMRQKDKSTRLPACGSMSGGASMSGGGARRASPPACTPAASKLLGPAAGSSSAPLAPAMRWPIGPPTAVPIGPPMGPSMGTPIGSPGAAAPGAKLGGPPGGPRGPELPDPGGPGGPGGPGRPNPGGPGGRCRGGPGSCSCTRPTNCWLLPEQCLHADGVRSQSVRITTE